MQQNPRAISEYRNKNNEINTIQNKMQPKKRGNS